MLSSQKQLVYVCESWQQNSSLQNRENAKTQHASHKLTPEDGNGATLDTNYEYLNMDHTKTDIDFVSYPHIS